MASASTLSSIDLHPIDLSRDVEPIQIIAHPCCPSRLRYRSDFNTNRNRRGVLRSQNNPNYQCPTIRIPQKYLDFSQHYYIRISLVTIVNKQTNCRYIHPYEIEDATMSEYNDPVNNAIWFPIEEDDKDGMKSFPNLRIIKKTEGELKNYGDLRVFDPLNISSTSQLSSPKITIKEFNLDRFQLAFTVGKRTVVDGNLARIPYVHTTVFTNEIAEIDRQRSDEDEASVPSALKDSQKLNTSVVEIHKYLPRKGDIAGSEEILIIFIDKLRTHKYGNLEISFECKTSPYDWSEPVLNLEIIHGNMVLFRTPRFPFCIDSPTTVNIVLKQGKRTFPCLKFDYISEHAIECSRCHRNCRPVAQSSPKRQCIAAPRPNPTEANGNDNHSESTSTTPPPPPDAPPPPKAN